MATFLPVASVLATKTIPDALLFRSSSKVRTHPCPTFLIFAYIDDGSSELTTDRSLSMIWASFMVLILRSTGREGVGAFVAGVVAVPPVSVGFTRCVAGAALAAAGGTLDSMGFAGGAAGGRGGPGALRSAVS